MKKGKMSDKQRKAMFASLYNRGILKQTSIEKVNSIQQERALRSKKIDSLKTSKHTVSIGDEFGRSSWANNPGKYDVEGIDDKSDKKLTTLEGHIDYDKIEEKKIEEMQKTLETKRDVDIAVYKNGVLLKSGFENMYDARNFISKQLNYNEDQKFVKGLSFEKLGYTTEVLKNKTVITNSEELQAIENKYKNRVEFEASPHLIDKRIANQSHAGTSFDPEKRAKYEIESFEEIVNNTYEFLKAQTESDEQREMLREEMTRFEKGYAEKYNSYLASKGRVISPMITGPSNFPVRRNQKALNAERNKWEHMEEWRKKATDAISRKINRENKQKMIEEGGGELAVMKAKLESAERDHERMKITIKILRDEKLTETEKLTKIEKEAGLKGHSVKELSRNYSPLSVPNSNARIRRIKERVKELEAKESRTTDEFRFNGGVIVNNADLDRVQIIYNEKPPQEVISRLKGEGWHWSPSNKAWQRKLTNAAEYSAKKIVGAA